jgi:GntR family transcriptional repressor for pyruvate dehydrogenase complex
MQQTDFLPKLATYLIAVAESNAGKAPSERELAEHFTVSRGQVRESLAILEAMQVIERRAKSGIYLRKDQRGIEQLAFFARAGLPVDPRQIYEAVEVRKIHEIKAAEMAAERATEENFATLESILSESESRIKAGEALGKLDHDFHLEIVRATQNEVFYNLCTTFYVLSEKRLSIYFKEGNRNHQSHSEHQQIYDALRRRDGALSMALMNSHLRGAMSYWSELLEDKDTTPLQ